MMKIAKFGGALKERALKSRRLNRFEAKESIIKEEDIKYNILFDQEREQEYYYSDMSFDQTKKGGESQ